MGFLALKAAAVIITLTLVLAGCSESVTGHGQPGSTRPTSSVTSAPSPSTPSPSPPASTTAASSTPPPAAPSSTAPPNPVTVYFGRCYSPGNPLQIEPSSMTFGCDGTGDLANMHWTSWSLNGADGTGTTALNDCTPDCASGKQHYFTVVVHLGSPKPAPNVAACTNHAQFYSTLIVAFPNGWPTALFGGPPPTTYRGMGAESYDALPNITC